MAHNLQSEICRGVYVRYPSVPPQATVVDESVEPDASELLMAKMASELQALQDRMADQAREARVADRAREQVQQEQLAQLHAARSASDDQVGPLARRLDEALAREQAMQAQLAELQASHEQMHSTNAQLRMQEAEAALATSERDAQLLREQQVELAACAADEQALQLENLQLTEQATDLSAMGSLMCLVPLEVESESDDGSIPALVSVSEDSDDEDAPVNGPAFQAHARRFDFRTMVADTYASAMQGTLAQEWYAAARTVTLQFWTYTQVVGGAAHGTWLATRREPEPTLVAEDLLDDLAYELEERAPRLVDGDHVIERGLSREQQLWAEAAEQLVMREPSQRTEVLKQVVYGHVQSPQHHDGSLVLHDSKVARQLLAHTQMLGMMEPSHTVDRTNLAEKMQWVYKSKPGQSRVRHRHVESGDAQDSERVMQHVPLMPMIEETFEQNKLKPVISIGDGDHRVNNHTISVMVRRNGDRAEAFDNCEGAQDCTLPHIGDPILARLREGACRGLHVAIDCKSFSPIAEQVRSMRDNQVRGMRGLNASQQKRVDVGNAFADYCIDALWAAFAGSTSFTAEFQQFRGDESEPEPRRVFWADKADYPTLLHFPAMKALLAASGAEVFTVWFCMFGGEYQQCRCIVAWPKSCADRIRPMAEAVCHHKSHAKLLVGAEAFAGRVYPEPVAYTLAHAHLVEHKPEDVDYGFLANMHQAKSGTLRVMSDNGATEWFLPDDSHCVPGTDGAPTIRTVGVGKNNTVMEPWKSCVLPIKLPNSGRIIMPRVNIGDVPMAIMSEGHMTDNFRAYFKRGPDNDWSMELPGNEVFPILPGPGRLARLGFVDLEIAPSEALFLMGPVSEVTTIDDIAIEPVEVECAPGGLFSLTAGLTTNVHFSEPQFTDEEWYRLAHARRMHPAHGVLVATHDPSITVGHDFRKLSGDTIRRLSQEGCNICNAAFMQKHPKTAPSGKDEPYTPMGVIDQFGPVSTPSIFHGYVYANTVVESSKGGIVTGGSVGADERVMEELVNEFRAVMRPWLGEIMAVRADMMKQTSVSKRWQRYARSDEPFVSQNATGHKHNPIGLVEILHKGAWPRVLAALIMTRRSLEWWYVCWRHAVHCIMTDANRRNESLSSRWVALYGVPYNQSHDRVILSPCQYYVDKEARLKPDARARNGLWCGFSPFNVRAAWIWTGKEFITCDHGDVRTNEWIAWTITPVGTPHPGLFDAAGDALLFTEETIHRSEAFHAVPRVREAAPAADAGAQATPVAAHSDLAQRLVRAHEVSRAAARATAEPIAASAAPAVETAVPEAASAISPQSASASISTAPARAGAGPNVRTRGAARGHLMAIFDDATFAAKNATAHRA